MGARRLKQKEQGEFSVSEFFGSRQFKLTLLGVFLVSGFLAINRLYQPQTLPFNSIQVFGELAWTDRDQLNQVILDNVDGGFFSLNIKNLKENIEQQAWIKSVAIRRVWPDVLQITANEQQPIAVWNGGAVINRQGELFDPLDQKLPKYLVKVSGPEGSHQQLMTHYFAMEELFRDVGLTVASIDINDRRALQVILTNGVRLLLGRVRNDEESAEEVRRFVAAYKEMLSPKIGQISLVDLRYTNGLAVRWKQQTSKATTDIKTDTTSKTTTTKQQTLGAIRSVMVQG
jgi:cell division protein FtsQ